MKDISFFQYYFYTIIGYLLVYSIGHLLQSLFLPTSEKNIYTELKKNIVGFIFILCVFSIYKTHFHTINIGWIIIGLALFFKKRINFNATLFKSNWKRTNYKLLLWQLFILSVIFTYSFYLSKSFTSDEYYLPFANPYRDPYFYSHIVNNLVHYGIENTFYNETSTIAYNNVTLYHYGELWFAAFFETIFRLRTLYVFSLITFSIYSTYMVLAGLSLIFFLFNRISKYNLLFAPLLLVVSGISFFYPLFSFMDTTNVDTGIFNMPKYPMLLLFILIQFIFIYKKDYFLFLLASLSILIVYTGLIAPLGLSVAIFFILLCIFREIPIIQTIQYALFALVFLICTVGVIFLLNSQPVAVVADDSLFNLKKIFSIVELVALAKYIIAYSIKFFLSLLLPMFILLVYRLTNKQSIFFSKKKKMLFLYILILFSSAIFTSGLFLKMIDSFQFRINLYTTVSSVIVFIIIQFFILQKNKMSIFFTFILVFLAIYQTKAYKRFPNNYDKTFARNVLKEYKGGNIAWFIDNEKNYMNVIVYFPMEYMMHYSNKFYPICVNVFDGKKSTDIYLSKAKNIIIPLTSFYQFYIIERQKQPSKTIQQIETDYIKKYNFKFIVYENIETIPFDIQSQIKNTYFSTEDNMYFAVLK